jgi:chromosome segregation ATPase
MRDDHATALREAATAAEEARNKAVMEAIQRTEEKAAGEREAALVAAAEEANRERAEAIAEREVELKAEQDSKLAALHRANEESMRKLRAEHDQASEEAAQAAAQHLADRERELDEEKAAALAAHQSQNENRLAEVDAQRARLASDLQTRTEERDTHAATVAERDRKIEGLEAALASQRVEVVELGDKLELETTRVTQAREKWAADEAALRSAKEALDKARADVDAALGRTLPE